MKAIILDFEATDTSEDAQATEYGYMEVAFTDKGLVKALDFGVVTERCKPERDISFGAMAVTNIFPEDLQGEASHTEVLQRIMPKGAAYIIGHNIDFDIRVAANAGVDVSQYKAICTLAIMRNLYPDADSHTLGAMSCMLDRKFAREHIKDAHGAAADVVMCARLLHQVCKQMGINDMQKLYEFSEFARVPTHMTFGKHKGKAIADMAQDYDGQGYLKWVVNTLADQPYLQIACKKALGQI